MRKFIFIAVAFMLSLAVSATSVDFQNVPEPIGLEQVDFNEITVETNEPAVLVKVVNRQPERIQTSHGLYSLNVQYLNVYPVEKRNWRSYSL